MTPLTTDQISSALPEFTISSEIEEGNIKRVFDAEFDGDRVALKLIPLTDGSERLEEYTNREIEIMKSIDSNVIVELVDHWVCDISGTPTIVIVEEFIEGPSLKERIQSGPCELELGVRVASTILDVLPEFESLSAVHRDIKPENLKLSEEGIKLLDMGVARMTEKETLTPDLQRRGPGTVAYSAPEVLRNDRDSQDVRTDIFSTGVVFFEAATGDHPYDFTGMDIGDAIREQQRKDYQGYIGDREIEEMVNKFYKRMTEYEPADRFRKPEHANDDLLDIANMVLP